ncbi:Xaa-Pro peptidase family protein [uncultured Brevibacillus sp.]|uniref:M24 family metallopeptidase n=1 Tax=uncultured Brevibacillus sp. TaxID=169970 RepID=UPI0025986382|nr:Xaa-Pro peptidase family protein [uncultured Brevibacillus sp.]
MEVKKRLEHLRNVMEEKQLTAILITDPYNQHYISGFKAVIYSRPIYYLITRQETALVVPGLEEEHARAKSVVDRICVYYEHPEKAGEGIDPIRTLLQYLQSLGMSGKIGVEFPSMSLTLGGALKQADWELIDISEAIMGQRAVKNERELKTIREAGHLASLALRASLEAARVGITELEIDHIGNIAVLEEVSKTDPDAVVTLDVISPSGIERSLLPHVFSTTKKVEKGDIIIHSRQLSLNGYKAESERTFFVGEPTERQKAAFEVMVSAQQAALDSIKAGIPMKEVDKAARSVIQKAGYGEYAIHRSGHSIGLAVHEPPYLRFDENAPLLEGMVFTIEPGFYVPGIGGFRHSDTIIVTRSGYEMVTNYPSLLHDLIL